MPTDKQEASSVKNVCGVDIFLMEPDAGMPAWVGQREPLELLKNAWTILEDDPRPMNPILVGQPGCGKTMLGRHTAGALGLPLYMMNCTNEMRPEDLIITTRPAHGEGSYSFDFAASPLTSAIISGGVCILDEANRMDGECWSSLASLLDDRRYVESRAAGVKIRAHPEFRFLATMNDDEETEDIPEYVQSRLKPVIRIGMPTEKELLDIMRVNLPSISEATAIAIIKSLESMYAGGYSYSVRDAIDAARLNMRNVSIETSVECVLRKAAGTYGL